MDLKTLEFRQKRRCLEKVPATDFSEMVNIYMDAKKKSCAPIDFWGRDLVVEKHDKHIPAKWC